MTYIDEETVRDLSGLKPPVLGPKQRRRRPRHVDPLRNWTLHLTTLSVMIGGGCAIAACAPGYAGYALLSYAGSILVAAWWGFVIGVD